MHDIRFQWDARRANRRSPVTAVLENLEAHEDPSAGHEPCRHIGFAVDDEGHLIAVVGAHHEGSTIRRHEGTHESAILNGSQKRGQDGQRDRKHPTSPRPVATA
jgi:hypothetical protein